MNAARYYPPTPQPSSRRKTRRPSLGSQSPEVNSSKVAKLPRRRNQLPESLQFLLLIQKGSTTLSFCLVTVTLAVYGWTVCAPSLWSQEFRKLTKLQRDERHLVGTNETLKHQLGQQAQNPGSGLAQPNPKQLFFLDPASVPSIEEEPAVVSQKGDPFVPQTAVAY